MSERRPDFYSLMRNRKPASYLAFDVLWLNERDVRGLRLRLRNREIERRKRVRTCFIGGRREREEVKGGGVPVILGDELPPRARVGAWRDRCGASRRAIASRERATGVTREGGGGVVVRDARATRAGGSGAPVAASTAASSRYEHATGVTRGRAGVASAQNVPLAGAGAAAARPLPAKYGRFIAVRACKGRDAAAWVGGVARARFDRRASEIDRGARVSHAGWFCDRGQ